MKISGLRASNVVSIQNLVLTEVQVEDSQGSNDGTVSTVQQSIQDTHHHHTE